MARIGKIAGGLVVTALLAASALAQTEADGTEADDEAGSLQTQGDCSPLVTDTQGNVTIDISCPTGLSERQLALILEALEENRGVPADQFEDLAQRLGVTRQALETFFALMGKENVPAAGPSGHRHQHEQSGGALLPARPVRGVLGALRRGPAHIVTQALGPGHPTTRAIADSLTALRERMAGRDEP